MTADGLLDELTERLGSRREATWMLEELAGLDDEEREARARDLATRREAGEPLQYVLGHWPFRELDLLVDARALVPRPETELLVERALELVSRSGASVVADLGCGSGAIALSLAIECRALGHELAILATDLSPGALELAEANAARLGATGITFHCGSWYEALPADVLGQLDLVCANPPYVSVRERRGLSKELDYEPELALVAADGPDGTEGFAAVEAVIAGAATWLRPGGSLLVEHGSGQGGAVRSCAERAGLDGVLDHVDLAGLPRFLEATRPT